MCANLGVAYFDSRSLITGSYVFVAINPDVTNLEQVKRGAELGVPLVSKDARWPTGYVRYSTMLCSSCGCE